MNGMKLYPLTHPQQRIWYTEKLHPGTGMWNNAGTLKIKGKLDLDRMIKSVNLFIKNNEAMRIRITEIDGEPFQYVSPFVFSQFDYLDFTLRGLQGLYEWDSVQSQSYIPLLDRELFYIAIVKISSEEFVWYAKVHHIISDAWSLVMFSNQVMEYYDSFLSGKEPQEFQGDSYIKYIEKEQEYLNSKRFLLDKQCLNEIFEDIPELTVLKQKKTNYNSTRARRKAGIIPKTIADNMRIFCEKQNVSIFPLYLSSLCIYINRILGKDDIVIGVPVFNRSKEERNTVGMFVSTVPIRIKVVDDTPFDQFVKMVSTEWFRILKHQKYPYELLLADLRKKHRGLESLYDITLSYQNAQFEKSTSNFTYEGRWHFSESQVNSLSIHINDRENEGRLIVDYDHLIPLFSLKEIEYIHSHCVNILTDAISHPDKKLYELDIMPPEELNRVLHEFNAGRADYPMDRGLDALFLQQMKKTPDEIALIAGTNVLTYRQLNDLVNKTAHYLKTRGIGGGDIVGIIIAREYTLIASILGVIRAGGAFLPIDPDFPDERVQYELKESGAKCVIATPHLALKCKDACEVILTDGLESLSEYTDAIPSNNRMSDLAYVIYTSGSTGRPKGVMVEQSTIVPFLYSLSNIMDFISGNIVLSAATISFDLFIMETFPTLLNGGTVVLAGENEHNIPQNLVGLIMRTRINKIMTTPSRMQLFMSDKGADECLKNMKEIMLGGDVLPGTLLAEIKEKTSAKIFNFYGPTEVTIAATYKDVTSSNVVNIGKPLPGVRAYILDKHKNPVPIGVHGELYIGGIGLSRGYLNRPDLTAESFLEAPILPGERIYKTGDMTRWFPMGEIEYLGRVDQQVKIRGFRIELGEIETKLLQIQGITACAVMDRQDDNGRKYLCAYICGDRKKSIGQIRSELSKELPAYMVPSYFIWMDSLPLSPSGKVDRKVLPEPDKNELKTGANAEPLHTPTQKALADIWGNALKVKHVGRTDNFFDIGGDSLSIVMVSSEVYKRFKVEVSLEKVYEEPTLENYARLIDIETQKTDSRPILPVRGRKEYPVSAAQRQIFIVSGGFLAQNIAYNIPGAYHIKGNLDIPALERAFKRLIAKNESLRTYFEIKKGALCQKIASKVDFRLEVVDCNKTKVAGKLKALVRPFDLAAPPLFRAVLLRIAANEFVLFLDLHHIIADGMSAGIILSQLSRLYMGKNFPANEIGYKDYAVWQAEYLQSEHAALQRAFWKENLSGDLPTLNLNTDYPRGAVQSFEGGRITFMLQKESTVALRTLAQRSGVTMYMLLLAVYTVFLSKYTGQKDIIVGTPVSIRTRHELMDIVGMFVNTIPLRNQVAENERFLQLLERVRDNCIAAFQNQIYPFESMANDLRLEKDLSRNPVFGTMLTYNTFDVSSIKLKDVKTKLERVNQPIAKFDLSLEVYDKSTSLKFELEYCTRLFKKDTVEEMALHFKNIVDVISSDPEIEIRKINLLSAAEQRKILYDFNNTTYIYDENIPVIRLFERIVEKYPDKTALICNGETLTYAQLNNAAEAYAKQLLDLGVGREHIVGVCVNRSLNLMCAILGILKTGAAYMPVDPFYPEDRKTFMLEDSGSSVLITDSEKSLDFSGKVIMASRVDEDGAGLHIKALNKPSDLAYVIYTSGSTGKPKGVMLSVSAFLNLFETARKENFYSKNTVAASVTTVSFDIFVFESLIPLFFGATMLLCTEDECRQPHLLVKATRLAGANFLQTTPSRMRIMMRDKNFRDSLPGFSLIILAGEPFPADLLEKIKKCTKGRVMNGYGPSETTVYSSFKDLTHTSRITIGKPVLNTWMYILDADRMPVPIGCPGELFISGKGVSHGYINRDELTKERFIKNPFAEGTMYQTGDICAYLPDGEILYKGRADHQVKIRGLRIELGEIESAISDYTGVDKAIVVDFGKDEAKYLCAYYTKNGDVDENALRESLRRRLPVYMVPSYFIALHRFPMTPGGKLDRKALPHPELWAAQNQKAQPAQKTVMNATQKKMVKVWKQVLKVENIGLNDNFFDLGGDSLAVIQVQIAIMKYGFQIKTQDFYELQTLGAICGFIDKKPDKKTNPVSEYEQYALGRKGVKVPYSSAGSSGADLDCVLLTGANGYLGAHILAETIDLYNSTVYCIIRENNFEDCQKKLKKSLLFYFGQSKTERYMQNVHVVCGDIAKPQLGIAPDECVQISSDVKTVIHCAAFTNHYGMTEIFEKANILGTKYITEFCLKLNKPLLYISTISVLGGRVQQKADKTFIFDETSYYIGQDYANNEYTKSKFLAEGIVLKAGEEGLDIRIFRVGNLTARLSDGKFQMVKENNAFANRLKSIFEIGFIPQNIEQMPLEFTPVDCCARAMLLLSRAGGEHPLIYHLFNHKKVALKDVLQTIELKYPVKTVLDSEFRKTVHEYSLHENSNKLFGIISDIEHSESFKPKIHAMSEITARYLNHAGFDWPMISPQYIIWYVDSIMGG